MRQQLRSGSASRLPRDTAAVARVAGVVPEVGFEPTRF